MYNFGIKTFGIKGRPARKRMCPFGDFSFQIILFEHFGPNFI